MNELLRLEHIQKIYGNGGGVTRAIDDISFSVSSGEFLGIMGASGSGKTTLLNCISTIDTVSAGSILLEGRDITQLKPKELARFRRENLGFIFQDSTSWTPLPWGKTSPWPSPSTRSRPARLMGRSSRWRTP